jgi:hypothetical protein
VTAAGPMPLLAFAACAALLGASPTPRGASPAGAERSSSNWAGYVASARPGSAPFTRVGAHWVLPRPRCGSSAGVGPTAAAIWVGLSGGGAASGRLEQAGTDDDCSASGVPHSFAWYEFAPAQWVRLPLQLAAGDTIAASVERVGDRVTVAIADLSRGTGVTRRAWLEAAASADAEWIVEAPSLCITIAFCGQQMLTDFGTLRFSDASARAGPRTGSIANVAWRTLRVSLRAGGTPFGGLAPEQNAAAAVPSRLSAAGSGFAVRWRAVPMRREG